MWIVIAAVLAAAWRRPTPLLVIPVLAVGSLLARLIKAAVGRPRPNLDPLVRLPTDSSFPSGHATTSFAAATFLSLLAPRLAPALYLLATAIAFSRVYVGVHYPTDVLAGAALGTAVGALGFTALRRLGRSPRRSSRVPPQG